MPVNTPAAIRVFTHAACLALVACHSTSLIGEADADTDAVTDTFIEPLSDPASDSMIDPSGFCVPSEGAEVRWEVICWDWTDEDIIDVECMLVDVSDGDGGWMIVLDCTTDSGLRGPLTLQISTNPGVEIPLRPGIRIVFTYIANPDSSPDRYFRLGTPSVPVILIGIDASSYVPPGWDISDWYDTLASTRAVDSDCPQLPVECGILERWPLEVRGPHPLRYLVFDGTALLTWDLDVIVGRAVHYTDMECDDIPESWYSVLFVLEPS